MSETRRKYGCADKRQMKRWPTVPVAPATATLTSRCVEEEDMLGVLALLAVPICKQLVGWERGEGMRSERSATTSAKRREQATQNGWGGAYSQCRGDV